MTWITVKDAVKLAQRSPATIYQWIADGRLRTTRQYDGTTLIDDRHLIDIEPTIRRGPRPRDTPTDQLDAAPENLESEQRRSSSVPNKLPS